MICLQGKIHLLLIRRRAGNFFSLLLSFRPRHFHTTKLQNSHVETLGLSQTILKTSQTIDFRNMLTPTEEMHIASTIDEMFADLKAIKSHVRFLIEFHQIAIHFKQIPKNQEHWWLSYLMNSQKFTTFHFFSHEINACWCLERLRDELESILFSPFYNYDCIGRWI